MVAKLYIWMQKGKHNMPSRQLREMQKRRGLLALKTIKEKTSMSPSKCVHKIRTQMLKNAYKVMMVIFPLMIHQIS